MCCLQGSVGRPATLEAFEGFGAVCKAFYLGAYHRSLQLSFSAYAYAYCSHRVVPCYLYVCEGAAASRDCNLELESMISP